MSKPTRRQQMADLYTDRIRRGVCLTCEAPAHPYMRCDDCRADQALAAADRRLMRRMTTFTILTLRAHTST